MLSLGRGLNTGVPARLVNRQPTVATVWFVRVYLILQVLKKSIGFSIMYPIEPMPRPSISHFIKGFQRHIFQKS